MRVQSHAKINWSLRILRKRDDGYHEIETLFQTISLHDTLTFRKGEALSFSVDEPSIPADETNLVMRAARAIGSPPVVIDLQKRIPAGGGLGGGSSNAAATLVALDRIFSLGRSSELPAMAAGLGSDVPFFLQGGMAYATGRGEKLTPLPAPAAVPLLLLLPEERVSTAEAYGSVVHYSAPLGEERVRKIVEGDFLAHAAELMNDFEPVIFERLPRLRELKRRLLTAGAAWAGMSGSGSTIVGAFRDAAHRDAAFKEFLGVRAVAAETLAGS